jgi:hypothetical protein
MDQLVVRLRRQASRKRWATAWAGTVVEDDVVRWPCPVEQAATATATSDTAEARSRVGRRLVKRDGSARGSGGANLS